MSPAPTPDAMVAVALDAAGRAPATGDVPIGAAVFSPTGSLLAAACNAREALGDPTAHAEILALRAAAPVLGDGWRLAGCTLAVTLEPCAMCAGALVLARVSTVVFGAWEPKTGAVGSQWDVVRDRRSTHRAVVVPPSALSPPVADACAALLRSFFTDHR